MGKQKQNVGEPEFVLAWFRFDFARFRNKTVKFGFHTASLTRDYASYSVIGGCCKECGSVEPFRKDCPELQKKRGISDVSLATIPSMVYLSADAEESLMTRPIK